MTEWYRNQGVRKHITDPHLAPHLPQLSKTDQKFISSGHTYLCLFHLNLFFFIPFTPTSMRKRFPPYLADSACFSGSSSAAVVMYNTVPAKVGHVMFLVGNKISPTTSPSGEMRMTRPAPYRALHKYPSSSKAEPSKCPGYLF